MRVELPWMGLGLSSNLNAREVPHPFLLLDSEPGLFDYLEYSAPLSLAKARREASLFPEMWARRSQVKVLFHPVHLNLYGPSLESAQAIADLAEHLEAVGSPWVSNDVAWWHHAGRPFPGYFYIAPPLTAKGVEDCAAHALQIQDGIRVPLLLENPAVIARRGEMHVLKFMAALHARTGLGLLLDLGHLLSHQLSLGLSPLTALDALPLEEVVEMHIAGGVVTDHHGRCFYVDDHTQPLREELLVMLAEIAPRCPRLRGITFEADGHPPEVAAAMLRRLRRYVPGKTLAYGDLQPGPRPASFEPQTRPWEIFDEAYGRIEPTEDQAGAEVETDFRLAVIAEQLDRAWPLTRLLLAGAREQLLRFAKSAAFRGAFQGRGKELGEAFAGYARSCVRDEPDEAVATALAFETWVQQTPPAPLRPIAPGKVGLAEGVAVRSFPVDLSELQFAARSLKRHLAGRAWVTGRIELSALESLRQVARRASPGPWVVAVREEQGRRLAIGLSRELSAVLSAATDGGSWQEFRRGSGAYSAAAVLRALELGLIQVGR
ncbi:MAG TPA: DUF692 family protein [Myxococcaceae bacterium]|nr:DUF692 family protein [Myxococcaceae bacterium]